MTFSHLLGTLLPPSSHTLISSCDHIKLTKTEGNFSKHNKTKQNLPDSPEHCQSCEAPCPRGVIMRTRKQALRVRSEQDHSWIAPMLSVD